MQATDLIRFILKNNIEYNWHGDEVYMFVDFGQLNKWQKILGSGVFDESGLNCTMHNGYCCFEMRELCARYGITLMSVFAEELQQG